MTEQLKRNTWLVTLFVLWCALFIAIGMGVASQVWGYDKTEADSCEQALTVGERITVLEQQNNSFTYDMWQAQTLNNDQGMNVAAEAIHQNREEIIEQRKAYQEHKQTCLN